MHHELQRKVLGALDVSYTDESGLYELVDAAQDQLSDLEVTQDKLVMRRFMKELVSDKGLAAYGENEVRHNLELGAVEILLLSEDLRKTRAKIECTNRSCDFSDNQTRSRASAPLGNCLKCGSCSNHCGEEDIVSDLSKLADQSGAEVKIISTEFEEGAAALQGLWRDCCHPQIQDQPHLEAMRTIEVTICSSVRPTERVEKVVSAIENIFPGLIMDIRADRIEAYNGPDSLKTLHELLRKQEILDTARSVMLRGLVGNTIQFQLNKQAALMGFVSFPPEEEPLGSLHVQITGGERVINWLAPETENGVPVREIDLSELGEAVQDGADV